MLTRLDQVLIPLKNEHRAVGAFNCVDVASARAIISAAEECKSPVVLAFAEVHRTLIPLEIIASVMETLAKEAGVPVAVHLDHGSDKNYIRDAIRLGFTSVMFDGSALTFDENVKQTAEIVEYAHTHNVAVEGELGQMPNSETGAACDNGLYTNPLQAAEFVAKTGVDALAIAFGTAHGVYAKAPALKFEIIQQIQDAVSVPLVMHGGSGVSKEGFQQAIRHGITKINYFTYMSLAGAEAIQAYAEEETPVLYHIMLEKARIAMQADAMKAMMIFQEQQNPSSND